jgi:hypothetical protein
MTAKWYCPQYAIKIGEKYSVEVTPVIAHLTSLMKRSKQMKQKYPGAVGKPYKRGFILCHSNPDSAKMIKEFVAVAVKDIPSKRLVLWFSELEGPRGVCHCKECKGNQLHFFVSEVKSVVAAVKEIKKTKPDLKICLWFTQGTYPHHLELIKLIPKDITIGYYDGKVTYKTYLQKYNLPESVHELQLAGFKVGSVPSLTASHFYGGLLMFPFKTPRFMKMMMTEAYDREMVFIMPQIGTNFLMHDFNTQAEAEFAWNSKGRTPKEFTVSWATRTRMNEPGKVADVMMLTEYSARGLSATIRASSMKENLVVPLTDTLVRGIKGGGWRLPISGFERKTDEELLHCLQACQKATKIAKTTRNKRLYTGCVVLEKWIFILERYRFLVHCHHNKSKDKTEQEKAFKEIQKTVKSLPDAWNKWTAEVNPITGHWRNQAEIHFKELMDAFQPLLNKESLDFK